MDYIVRTWSKWGALLALSAALSAVLDFAGLPAALLLGPMIGGMVFGLRGATMRVPRVAFIGAQSIIGCLVARSLTASILTTMVHDWPAMLAAVLSSVAAGGLVGWGLMKAGTLPGTTAAWGSSPGAAAAMVAMAQEAGADARLVAFMQYLRVIVVVMGAALVSRLVLGGQPIPLSAHASVHWWDLPPLLPFIGTLAVAGIGAVAGRKLKVPAGAMVVPMITGAVLHGGGWLDITLPPWLLAVAYSGLGWYIGLTFDRAVVLHAIRAVPVLLLSTLSLIGLCGLSAWLLTLALHTDPLTAYLATSPGGLDSVAIIAVGSGADISLVLAVQTIRLFVVILACPWIARLLSRMGRPRST